MMYRLPAEWEPHEGTWIAWPHNREHWPGKFDPIPEVYVKLVAALAHSERVFICVNDRFIERQARQLLEHGEVAMKNVELFRIPTNASWSRDHGPMFVRGPEGLTILDWDYNGNGNKWKPYDKDDAVPTKVAEKLDLPVIAPGIVLEGGSIEVNGVGTLLTTESCLLNKNRNPRLNREQIEGYLREYLGVSKILWLKQGIVGDDTDGHVDDLARFVDRRTVVCPVAENPADVDFSILKENYHDLRAMRDQDGNPLRVVTLPTPDSVVYEKERLPASYANFYIANTVVLVPTFRCTRDAEAIAVLQKLLPTRRVIGIDCVDLVWGFGTIHCSTMQQPRSEN